MRTVTHCIFALLPLLAIQTSHAEHFYKWVDEAGATHYTQTPPPQKKATTTVKVSTKLPADSEAAAKNLTALSAENTKATSEAEKTAAKDQAAAAADAERRKANTAGCAQAQASVAQLQSGQRIRSQDANGERTYLTDEQKATRIQQEQTHIKQNCPK